MANATTPVIQINEGKVGIGTSTPQALFNLSQADGANIRFDNTTTAKFFTIGEGVGTNGVFSFRGNSYQSTDTMSVDFVNDRVGVGTISPDYKLEVAGNITAKAGGDVFVNSIATTTTGRSFIKNVGDMGSVLVSAVYGSASTGTIFGVSATRAASIITTSDTGTHPSSLVIGTFTEIPLYLGTNDSSRITILGSGNVGINDTSPDFKLDVEGTFGVSDLPFNSSSVSVLVADETLGPELSVLPSAVSGVGDFYAFTQYGTNTIAYTAGTTETVITYVDNTSGAYQYLNSSYNLSSNLVIGSNYKVAITFKVNTGTFTWQVHNGGATTSLPASSNTSFETIEYINTPTHATNSFIRASGIGAGQIVTVSKVSVKQVISASNQIQKSELNNIPRTNPAASLYDLIPNGAFTTTYAFTSTAGTYAEVMSGNDVITAPGTYSVQMYVNDYPVGGTQYREYYSGVMSWNAPDSTNDTGIGAVSEIVLHRAGHAANQGITYLRTRETTDDESNELRLEIMCNRTYSGASNVIFKFVRLI